ncbi:hypothetical protein IRJ41_001589 [Triplophysa rosa]|uniref:CCHC-type domain-containing protein n=1 Tax=Triplophysa rosa TaxID=992332 RepID=A0A9W7T480_TRIRA|nr:hypothetical protein IRJ41_001589 [Triplophysa rosa]
MELAEMVDIIEKGKDDITKVYNEIRQGATPSTDLRRKIDACEAVTKDIMKIINERLSGIDGDFDAECEKCKLRELHAHDYAHSIYGTASQSASSHFSETTVMAAKRAEAAAELAAKEAQYKLMEEERTQKEKIRMMESELERLQAERDIKVARVRLESYDREIRQETDSQPSQQTNNAHNRQKPAISFVYHQNPSIVPPNPSIDVSSLARAIQDSIAINRLPMPMPTVFSGDPINYIEWRASFMSLLDRKGISLADKLYYLKKYVSGPAHKCIEGTFYRDDDEAYRDAWNKLNQRYGQPFVIQRAFRDKLSKWPKVQTKDVEGLRAYSDFLNACRQAMPHMKALEILNDCEENQKLTQLTDFAKFVSIEAQIACNPITSLHALHSSSSSYIKRSTNETKGSKVSVFSTQTNSNTENLRSNNGKEKPPCMWCKDDKHQLSKCTNFKERLCYGCVKPGHSAKNCRHRHTCELCKGRHPTCLHDENYKRHEEKDRPVFMVRKKSTTEVNAASNRANEIVTASPLCGVSPAAHPWVSPAAHP